MKKGLLILSAALLLILGSGFTGPDAKSHFDTGMDALNRKDYIAAVSEFTMAISMNPNYGDAYFHRAYAKELLGKKMGFESTELCSDLAMALQLGKKEATYKMEKICWGECYSLEHAFVEPEIVYCADFSSKLLTDLPDGSEKLHFVTRLNMFNNKLTTLSPKWANMNKVVSLDLSSNQITTVPAVIGNMKHIKELTLMKNKITTLPVEFGNLTDLRLLNMRQNLLTELPRSVVSLTQIETLDLSINKLTSLPTEIAGMKRLKTLVLVGNEIPVKEQQRIKALLPNTTIYFE